MLSAWVGGFRSIAVTAAAVTDAAAILSYPAELVERYTIDLAELLPGRTDPVMLNVMGVAWESVYDTGVEPVVMIVGGSTIAPPAGATDVATVSVRPSVQPKALMVSMQMTTTGATSSPPVLVDVRLGPENLVVDP